MMKSQSIRSSDELECMGLRLKLLVQAHKADRNIIFLEKETEYFKSKYPIKNSFNVSEFEAKIQEYIHNLESELQEEKDFIQYVIKEYCTVQNESPDIGGLPKKTSRWS